MGYCGEVTKYFNAEYIYRLHLEHLDAFAKCLRAINSLTESFKNLTNSTSLQAVQLYTKDTYPAVLNALNLASFPRQIVHVVPDLDNLRQPPDDRSLVPLAESPHLVSYIEYQATAHSNNRHVDPEFAEQVVAQTEHGCHYSGHESVNPSLSSLAAKLSDLDKITFHGRDYIPRLRLCHECKDVWARLFAKNTYAHLTHLESVNGYVIGSRLRGFIKRHSETLQYVKFDFVFLTDGNWCSIAQGLQKCPNLSYLDVGTDTSSGCYIESLRQKHAAPPLAVSLPEKYATSSLGSSTELQNDNSDIGIILRKKQDVAHWPDVFVRYFATYRSEVGDCWGACGSRLPVYHEVRTFFLPGHKPGTSDTRSLAGIALDKYLEADEGV